MVRYTFLLLSLGLVAALLGLDGVGAVAVQIAAILFAMEMAFELVSHLAAGRPAESE